MAQSMTPPTVESVLADPSTPYWVSRVLRKALTLDPVDAANGAEVLAQVLKDRCDHILAEMTEFIKTAKRCSRCQYLINEHGLCGCIPLDDEAP